jgi:hypothetical protein
MYRPHLFETGITKFKKQRPFRVPSLFLSVVKSLSILENTTIQFENKEQTQPSFELSMLTVHQ